MLPLPPILSLSLSLSDAVREFKESVLVDELQQSAWVRTLPPTIPSHLDAK